MYRSTIKYEKRILILFTAIPSILYIVKYVNATRKTYDCVSLFRTAYVCHTPHQLGKQTKYMILLPFHCCQLSNLFSLITRLFGVLTDLVNADIRTTTILMFS